MILARVQNHISRRSSRGICRLMTVILPIFLTGCMLPSFWIDDSDFQDNLPDNSILAYERRWDYEVREVSERKKNSGYRDDFLKIFPIGQDLVPATRHLVSIGATCKTNIEKAETIDTCTYRRKIKFYRGRGLLGANKSIWAEKTLMAEYWINVIYSIKSKGHQIAEVNVDRTRETIYQYRPSPDPRYK
jgi:hypothetical protein